jgi:hypothetical protein
MTTRTARIAVIAAASVAIAAAQQPLSPPAETSTTINGKTITIKYSAPSMRGRKIFGGLESYGKVWRAGANAATSLQTDADLDINGLNVPKGSYTLFVWLGGADDWSLIVSKKTGEWGLAYDKSADLGRVKMNVTHPSSPIETFKITLDKTGGNKGTLTMAWENTVASVPFTVH